MAYLEEPGLVVGVCERVFEYYERLVVDGAEHVVRGLLVSRDRHLERRRRLFLGLLVRPSLELADRLPILLLELRFFAVQLAAQRVELASLAFVHGLLVLPLSDELLQLSLFLLDAFLLLGEHFVDDCSLFSLGLRFLT